MAIQLRVYHYLIRDCCRGKSNRGAHWAAAHVTEHAPHSIAPTEDEIAPQTPPSPPPSLTSQGALLSRQGRDTIIAIAGTTVRMLRPEPASEIIGLNAAIHLQAEQNRSTSSYSPPLTTPPTPLPSSDHAPVDSFDSDSRDGYMSCPLEASPPGCPAKI